jgi:hypothetical protein
LRLTHGGRSICDTINRDNDLYYGKVFDRIPETEQASVIASFGLLVEAMQHLDETNAPDTDCCS